MHEGSEGAAGTDCHNYLGVTFQWIELFRQGGMTLPWSEDCAAHLPSALPASPDATLSLCTGAWQSPLGSQQMITLIIDVMRSSVTKHASFDLEAGPYAARENSTVYAPLDMPAVPALTGSPPLMMYVMPHFVGNSPASWRRQFYGDIAHGVKIFDLFEFVSSLSGYTCDYTVSYR